MKRDLRKQPKPPFIGNLSRRRGGKTECSRSQPLQVGGFSQTVISSHRLEGPVEVVRNLRVSYTVINTGGHVHARAFCCERRNRGRKLGKESSRLRPRETATKIKDVCLQILYSVPHGCLPAIDGCLNLLCSVFHFRGTGFLPHSLPSSCLALPERRRA